MSGNMSPGYLGEILGSFYSLYELGKTEKNDKPLVLSARI